MHRNLKRARLCFVWLLPKMLKPGLAKVFLQPLLCAVSRKRELSANLKFKSGHTLFHNVEKGKNEKDTFRIAAKRVFFNVCGIHT
jgi:hypothetical protein